MNESKKQKGKNHEDPKKMNAVPKIPVPTNYRNASKYVRIAVEEKRNIQPLIEQDKHFRLGRTLVGRALSNMPIIDAIYKQLDLATVEPRLNEWLAKVLISELLFGSGRLVGSSLPVECVKRYETQLRALLKDIEAKQSSAGLVKEPRFVRINTNQLNLEGAKRLLAEEEWMLVEENFTDYRSFLERVKRLGDSEYMEDFHFPDMLVFPHSAKSFWARAQHLQDRFLLQNKACLLPTYLLKPPKKSVVLDMCSAPGLKATHLASLMKNKGRIYAVEQDANRYAVLCEYAGPFGMIRTIHSDCLEVTDEQVPGVQYVLLDPSCSGSGMLQRQLVPEPIDEKRLYRLAGLQYKLLSHAMNAFPNVRRIVYSTCSVHAQENEGVVQGVLRHNGHFRLLDARKEFGKEWLNVGSPEYPGIGERCLYAKTVDDLTIGMFVAVFERCPEGFENEVYLAHEKQKHSYELVAKKLSRQGKVEYCPTEGENQQEEVPTAVQTVKDKSTSKKTYSENNTVEEQNDQEEVHEKASSKKGKHKSTEENSIDQVEEVEEKATSKKRKNTSTEENTVDEVEEVEEKATSQKRKHKSTEEDTVEELNGQEEVHEKASSKKGKHKSTEEDTVEEQNGQEEVHEKASSKKRKHKSTEENTIDQVEEVEEKATSKKRKHKSTEENTVDQVEEVEEKATSQKRKHKSTEEDTVKELNGQEEVHEKASSKKRKHKSTEENTVEEQNGQEEVHEKASSKKGKHKSTEENTVEEQNGQEEVHEKASSKKGKHKSTEENTIDQVEEVQEKASSKKRKNKSTGENTIQEQNGQEEGHEKASSKKGKHKSTEEDTVEEQNGQEEVHEKTSSKKRKHKSAEENTINQVEEVEEKASSKKGKHKSTEENTIDQVEEVEEKATSKKRKHKSAEENTINQVEEVEEKASSKKGKHKSTEENTIDQVEEVEEKATSKKRKHKSAEENTINQVEEVEEKATSKKRKNTSTEENTIQEQNGQEEVKKKVSSKRRKNNQ